MAQYEYTLGTAGELTSVKELDRTIDYTYDSLYRLVAEKITNGKGNVSEYSYVYDNVSNRILKTENGIDTACSYNALNQLIAENDTTYEYNADNKLIKATVQDGVNVTVEEYTYDYAGNRTSKSTVINGNVDITHYLNDISRGLTQVLGELDANGNEKLVYKRNRIDCA